MKTAVRWVFLPFTGIESSKSFFPYWIENSVKYVQSESTPLTRDIRDLMRGHARSRGIIPTRSLVGYRITQPYVHANFYVWARARAQRAILAIQLLVVCTYTFLLHIHLGE